MMLKPKLGCRNRRLLQAFSIAAVLLLAACGDKEEAPGPSRLAEISRAEAAVESEKSQRLLAESRLGTVLWLALLGAGGALLLGLAIGSSSRRETGGAQSQGPETDL